MKRILKHIGLMLGVTLVLILLIFLILRLYTKHDQSLVEVPDILELKVDVATKALQDLGLEVEVSDTVYKDGARMLEVINQNPGGGLKVKKGRKIYLVINSDQVPMVEMPELAGKTSLSGAQNILSQFGLKLGRVIERPCSEVRSTADQPVIDQFAHGDSTHLSAGTLIERNSKVDLVICIPVEQLDSASFDFPGASEEEVIELH